MILQNNTTYTAAEMAEWFGITRKAFTNSRKKRLSDLACFCTFSEPKRGRYYIEEVFIPEYDKDLAKTYGKVKKALPQYLQSIDTCINVGTKINREVFKNKYTDKYIAAIVGQIIKDYPEDFRYKREVGFKKGENGYATFRLFTDAERELYYKTISDYVDSLAKDKTDAMKEAIDKRERGELSNKDFNKMNFTLEFNFLGFKRAVMAAFNLTDEEYANRLRDFDAEEFFIA